MLKSMQFNADELQLADGHTHFRCPVCRAEVAVEPKRTGPFCLTCRRYMICVNPETAKA